MGVAKPYFSQVTASIGFLAFEFLDRSFGPNHILDDNFTKLAVAQEAAEKNARMLKEHKKVGQHGHGMTCFKGKEKVEKESVHNCSW